MACEEQVRTVGELLLGGLPPDTRIAEVTVRGARAFVFFRLADSEDARRRACGAAPLRDGRRQADADTAMLRLLLGLPTGLPVPLRSLSDRDRTVLRRCPPGSVRVTDGAVERLAVPPLRLDLALIRDRAPSAGAVARAGRYASYAFATGLWVTGPKADVLGVLRSEWYGHGVVHQPPGREPELVAAPRLLEGARLTESVWRFIEEVYQSLRPQRAGFNGYRPTPGEQGWH